VTSAEIKCFEEHLIIWPEHFEAASDFTGTVSLLQNYANGTLVAYVSNFDETNLALTSFTSVTT